MTCKTCNDTGRVPCPHLGPDGFHCGYPGEVVPEGCVMAETDEFGCTVPCPACSRVTCPQNANRKTCTVPADDASRWPGERCKSDRCGGRRNVVGFSVSDEVWAAVVGDEDTILCPQCFDELAQSKGVQYEFNDTFPVSWSDWDKPDCSRVPCPPEADLETCTVPRRITLPEAVSRVGELEILLQAYRTNIGAERGDMDKLEKALRTENAELKARVQELEQQQLAAARSGIVGKAAAAKKLRAEVERIRPVYEAAVAVVDAWEEGRWMHVDSPSRKRLATLIEMWQRIHDAVVALRAAIEKAEEGK